MTDRALDITMRALDLPEDEQSAAIDAACAGDEALKARVLRLIAADRESEGFLEPRSSGLSGLESLAADAALPERIGRYRVLERIGEGGFGVVYKAAQTEPIERTVAIKVIKPGMDSRGVLRRFELERRSLSRMNHPYVARVLDGGATTGENGGRPYFVMELVEGEPITEYADRAELSTEERVRLMLQVCAAVQHAHSKGVIHRDLKPSNILVTTIDGEAVCKVIDFGVAKALESVDQSQTLATSPGAMVGTPQYMSPEQMRGSADIDTRTDVYALGVLLYEVIAGLPPFDPETWRGLGLGEMLRRVEEAEPPTPSSRALSRETAVQRPGAESRELPRDRRVPRDLDWVILRAMAKDPDRRYETAAALGDDLERFLAFEPVEAGPPSVRYRVSKFVRRNRAGVVAAAIACLGLVGGGVASLVFAVSAERARAEEQEQRETAERTQRRNQSINDFLLRDLFLSVRAAELGPDATLPELLDRAAPTVENRFSDDPDMMFRAHFLLGSMYNQMSEIQKSIEHFSRSIEVMDSTTDTGPMEMSTAFTGRGNAYLNFGQLENAAADFNESLSIIDSMDEFDPKGRRAVLASIATVYQAQGRYEEAEPLLAWCIETALTKEKPRDDYSIGVMMSVRGAMLDQLGRFEESLASAEEMIAFGEELEGNMRATTVLVGHTRRMSALTGLGKTEEIVDAAIEQVDLVGELFGSGSPNHALAKANAATVLRSVGRRDEAESYLLEAIEGLVGIYGPHHYEIERYTNSLATFYRDWERREDYLETRTRGLLLRLFVAGPGEQESVIDSTQLGVELTESPDAWIRIALDEQERVPPGHNKRARYLANLAIAFEGLGIDVRIEEMLTQAFAALHDAERPEEIRRILEDAMPAYFESRNRPDDAAAWRARLSPESVFSGD